MSHFTVLVVGEDVERQLAPFHEYECTGNNDEFVQDVDETAELRAEYETETKTMLVGPDRQVYDAYDDRFYRNPTEEERASIGPFGGMGGDGKISWRSGDWGDGYETRVREVPVGFEEIEVPMRDQKTFAEFVSYWTERKAVGPDEPVDTEGLHKYGYVQLDADGEVVRVVKRTNPNAKWDWYQVGGRWTGFFHLKAGRNGTVGEPGLLTDPVEEGLGRADSALKGDIDFEEMRNTRGADAAARWDKIHAIIAGRPVLTWKEMREKHKDDSALGFDVKAAREEFHAQQVLKDMNAAAAKTKDQDLLLWDDDEIMRASREDWVERARRGAVNTHAVLKDGQWYERGEMGWWGVVLEDKGDRWGEEYAALIDGLPDDTLLTVVDCHI